MIYCPTPSSLTNNWRDICLECERNSENIGQAPDEEPLLFCFVRFVEPFSVFGGGGGSGVEGGGGENKSESICVWVWRGRGWSEVLLEEINRLPVDEIWI